MGWKTNTGAAVVVLGAIVSGLFVNTDWGQTLVYVGYAVIAVGIAHKLEKMKKS